MQPAKKTEAMKSGNNMRHTDGTMVRKIFISAHLLRIGKQRVEDVEKTVETLSYRRPIRQQRWGAGVNGSGPSRAAAAARR
jgi:hypothetical protein